MQNTAENIKSGTRNPKNSKNSKYFFNFGVGSFLKFVLEGGITPNFDNLEEKSSIKFKNNSKVTRFLASKLELGKISENLLNYVWSFDSKHFSDFQFAESEENRTFIKYIEEISQ